MQTKVVKYGLSKMAQDIAESAHVPENYFSAKNLRLLTLNNITTGAIEFELGDKLKVDLSNLIIDKANKQIKYNKSASVINYSNTELINDFDKINLPDYYISNQVIIGHAVARNSIIFFTVDENTNYNINCIWEVGNINNSYAVKLLYIRNLNFNINNPIQAIYNYENDIIQKVYWVDGIHQIRAVNIKDEDLFNQPKSTINFVGNINFSQIKISTVETGGSHTAGVIQYAYNLYRLNSSQTKISPLSELVDLNKGKDSGGGDINESVSTIPILEIDNIDNNYTHIKVYSIKYTSYNEIPAINLIAEEEIGNRSKITIYDDGRTISNLSLEQFIFLGSTPFVPKHIETKDNILFPINIVDEFFDVDLDFRAYSFNNASTPVAHVYDNVQPDLTGNQFVIRSDVGNYLNYDKTKDAINLNYDVFKYQSDGVTLGGEGYYIKYSLTQNSNITNPEDYKFFKDNEIYRIGIQFYNNLGQISQAKWIADFKAPEGNLTGNYNTLEVELKDTFINYLNNNFSDDNNSQKPIGFKIIRAERTLADRSILEQGFIQPSMFQIKGDPAVFHSSLNNISAREQYQDQEIKTPTWITRTFQRYPNITNIEKTLAPTKHLSRISALTTNSLSNANLANDSCEVYTLNTSISQDRKQQTFQHSKLIYFYSPEILFSIRNTFPSDLNLVVVAGAVNNNNNAWGKEINLDDKQERFGGKIKNAIHFQQALPNDYLYDNNLSKALHVNTVTSNKYNFIGPNGESLTQDFYQYRRSYTGNYYYNNSKYLKKIYGTVEIAEAGAGSKLYNNDSKYEYTNSLTNIISDSSPGSGNSENDNIGISLNCYGARAAVLVLGDNTLTTNQRLSLEDLYTEATSLASYSNSILISELRRDNSFIYLGNLYKGNTYEERKRTTYIEIGDYINIEKNINNLKSTILSPGDTFVQVFKFARIFKTDVEILNISSLQNTEIVEVKLETTVDLKNRHDFSIRPWDTDFQPSNQEYHKYNRVYSQEPSLIRNNEFDFTFKLIKKFDNKILASKTKTPNEKIDSWTDLLENNELNVDGKYGPINATINYNDNIYFFQDSAFGMLQINPTAQVQVENNNFGLLELGRGGVLYNYGYISTSVGSINKWAIKATQSGVYFIDALNKTFNRFSNNGFEQLSLIASMFKFFRDNLDYNILKQDNPYTNSGITLGYNQNTYDVFISFPNKFCLAFNEIIQGFTSFYDYDTPMFIWDWKKCMLIRDKNKIYEMHAGEYNIFGGENKPSELTLICNPEPDHDVVFNNLEYKAEALDNNQKELDYTWEKIRAYHENQDSDFVNINYRKLNRKYRLIIPRSKFTTDRIRNTWTYITLSSYNSNKLYYRNNHILLYYNPRYIMAK